jgi:uncharacterized protein
VTPLQNIPFDSPPAVAIVAAIHRGDVAAVEQQLRAQPTLATSRIVDEKGVSRTLLLVVADWPGHLPNGAALVAALVSAGADVNARVTEPDPERPHETALHWAASSDDVAVLDALLDHGADIEAPGAIFTDGTAMSDAVVFAQWNAARRLLARGATTTIWQAAALGLVERVQELLAAAPLPTPENITNALWHACRGGQRGTVELLLANGGDPHWIGHERKTPLQVAHESGNDALYAWMQTHDGVVRTRQSTPRRSTP